MADIKSPEERSLNMARIRSKDTKPEIWLRKKLFAKGYRYRKNVKNVQGHPDAWLGFGFKDILGAFFKIKEETHKLQIAYQSCDRQNMADELGDLLFSVVNIARFIRVDPKECLSMATDKFIKKTRPSSG